MLLCFILVGSLWLCVSMVKSSPFVFLRVLRGESSSPAVKTAKAPGRRFTVAGASMEEILRDYPYLEREDILAASAYASGHDDRACCVTAL